MNAAYGKYTQEFMDKYPEVNWNLILKWEAMGQDTMDFWANFTSYIKGILLTACFTLILSGGGWIASIGLIIFIFYGLAMQSEYETYIMNKRMLYNDDFTNWRK